MEREEAQLNQERRDAERALSDPAIQRAFDKLEAGLVDMIVNIRYNDVKSYNAYEDEVCRTLRTVHRLRASLYLPEQMKQIEKTNLSMAERHNFWGHRKVD